MSKLTGVTDEAVGGRPAQAAVNDPRLKTSRTTLGARLVLLREQVVASGASLLNWEDLDRDLAEQRGRSAEAGE